MKQAKALVDEISTFPVQLMQRDQAAMNTVEAQIKKVKTKKEGSAISATKRRTMILMLMMAKGVWCLVRCILLLVRLECLLRELYVIGRGGPL